MLSLIISEQIEDDLEYFTFDVKEKENSGSFFCSLYSEIVTLIHLKTRKEPNHESCIASN